MDRAGFAAWLDRYVDAWRLGDALAIGDLFSPDVRYAFAPFDEAVVGRPAVVAAWLSRENTAAMSSSAVDTGFTNRLLVVGRRPATTSSSGSVSQCFVESGC